MDDTQQLLGDILSLADWETWQEAIDQVEAGLQTIKPVIDGKKFQRVFLVGCGTSYYTGQVGKHIFEQITGLPAEAKQSFSFVHYSAPGLLTVESLVIGISTTGETRATCEALSVAQQHGAVTLALTSVPSSSITRLAQGTILAGSNSPVIVKTRNYVQALLGVYLLAIHLAGDDPALKDRWMGQFRLAQAITAEFLVNLQPAISALAENFKSAENIFVLGNGLNFGSTEEAALKVIEMAKLYADGSEMEDFFHGRDREVVSKSPIFFLASQNRPLERMFDFLTFCRRNGVPSVVITCQEVPELQRLADYVFILKGALDELATPLVYITPIYLFSYHLALKRGFDPLIRRYPVSALKVEYKGSEFDPSTQERRDEI